MVEDRNKFVVAHNTWLDQEQRIKEGKRVLRKDYSMSLVRRVRTRDDAKISAAVFEEAVRAKASLANNKPLQEEKPADRKKPDLSNKQKVKDLVRKEALEQELDPDVIEKLAQAESGFRKDAVNKTTGAAGILQLLPEVAELIAAKTAWTVNQILHDPKVNVMAGIWLIKEYKTLFDGKVKDKDSLLAAVAAYKTSPQAVDRAIKQAGKERPRIDEVLEQKAIPEKAKNI